MSDTLNRNTGKKNSSRTTNRFFLGISIGFACGFLMALLTEMPLANLLTIFTDANDTSGLLLVKLIAFGFIGMILGGFFGLLNFGKKLQK